MPKPSTILWFTVFLLAIGRSPWSARAQESESPGQIADAGFVAKVAKPFYAANEGPTIGIDAAHHNFHTATGRYQPFAAVLRADGYQIKSVDESFSPASLKDLNVLVIANALAARNRNDWSLPTPSAFTDEEVDAVAQWVQDGGSLLLIADHMPFPGAAAKLGNAFDIQFYNGFVIDESQQTGSFQFSDAASDGNQLLDHPITQGFREGESIPHVRTFTGSCFTGPDTFTPIFQLSENCVSLEPQKAWDFDDETPKRKAAGLWQAATRNYGKGKLAFFGEAAMFTAQTQAGARKMGLSHPKAQYNQQFLLNTVHWLSEK